MLPAISGSNLAAVSIMQSIFDQQFRLERSLWPAAADEPPGAETAHAPKVSNRVLENVYFGEHMSVTEAMMTLFKRVGQYLAKKVDAVDAAESKGPHALVDGGETATTLAIRDIKPEARAALRGALAGLVDDIGSATQTAIVIMKSLDIDRLSMDRKLKAFLEEGIEMEVADLIRAIADPEGKAAEKVRAALAHALAGQAGSKPMQRLEDTAAGPRTVSEAFAEVVFKRPFDEVDEETKSEDEDDLETARIMETLRSVGDRAAGDAEISGESEGAAEVAAVKARIWTILHQSIQEGAEETEDGEESLPSAAYTEFAADGVVGDRSPYFF